MQIVKGTYQGKEATFHVRDDGVRNTFFICSVEVRKHGAIGEFEHKDYSVRAECEEIAREWAMDDAHADGFETRGILVMPNPNGAKLK